MVGVSFNIDLAKTRRDFNYYDDVKNINCVINLGGFACRRSAVPSNDVELKRHFNWF